MTGQASDYLEVTVDNVEGVQVLEGERDLRDVDARLVFEEESLPPDVAEQLPAWDVLHHEV